MSKQTEALKLALEAFEDAKKNHGLVYVTELCAIKEALAEQTALLAANKDLQNHFDALMNDYKKLSALCSSQGTRLMEYESSHEPESKPWVGLTDEQIDRAIAELGLNYFADAANNRAVLRELCKRAAHGIKGDA